MESWENKIIADKLNSLQDLPAGYTPDLSSKWEIVEAALPEKSKRKKLPVWVRWSVAAAVLIGVCIVSLNLQHHKQQGGEIVQHQINDKQSNILIPVREDTNRGMKVETTPAFVISPHQTKKEINAIAIEKSDLEKDAVIHQLDNISADTSLKNVVAENSPNSLPATDTPTISKTDLAATNTTIKPAKRKIYQRDFNDGQLAMDTGFSKPATQHFSIRILPFTNKSDDANSEQTRRFQIKTTL